MSWQEEEEGAKEEEAGEEGGGKGGDDRQLELDTQRLLAGAAKRLQQHFQLVQYPDVKTARGGRGG